MATAMSRKNAEDQESKALIERDPKEPVELVVFLRDRAGVYFHLEHGHLVKAEELLELVLEEQGLPPEAKESFSLWFVSSVLDVRLKPHHQPFQIIQQWDELCALYTDAKNEEIRDSEPVLMIQRDVFFSRDQELLVTNEAMLCLLYHEAKYNVVQGRYALSPEDYHRLAGIQALVHLGKYVPNTHMLGNYRSNMVQFYPESMYTKERFLFFGRLKHQPRDCEELFMEAHIRTSQEYADADINGSLSTLYRRYLEICRAYPFYGAAFFSGRVETPTSRFMKFILPPPDTDVLVGINTESISIINRARSELLLSIPFSQLLWEFRDPDFDGDNDPPPCLFLQFLTNETVEVVEDDEATAGRYEGEEGVIVTSVTKLLKVYSREAKLMDALIETCVRRKLYQRGGVSGDDVVDGPHMPDSASVKVLNKLEKLCLSTYTADGEQLEAKSH